MFLKIPSHHLALRAMPDTLLAIVWPLCNTLFLLTLMAIFCHIHHLIISTWISLDALEFPSYYHNNDFLYTIEPRYSTVLSLSHFFSNLNDVFSLQFYVTGEWLTLVKLFCRNILCRIIMIFHWLYFCVVALAEILYYGTVYISSYVDKQ